MELLKEQCYVHHLELLKKQVTVHYLEHELLKKQLYDYRYGQFFLQ